MDHDLNFNPFFSPSIESVGKKLNKNTNFKLRRANNRLIYPLKACNVHLLNFYKILCHQQYNLLSDV